MHDYAHRLVHAVMQHKSDMQQQTSGDAFARHSSNVLLCVICLYKA